MKTLAILALAPLAPALAQNGTMPFYQGFQPTLVGGTQDGFADAKPKIRHVYLAAPDTLALVVDAQAMPTLPLRRYEAQPGDQIRKTRGLKYGTRGGEFFQGRTVVRGGITLGSLVGEKDEWLKPAFTLLGEKLDASWAENPASYALSTGRAAPLVPTAVFRKTKPIMQQWTGENKQESTARHEIYLKFPRALTPGTRYTLAFVGGPFGAPVSWLFDDRTLRTEAIQVVQSGYHPAQSEKSARLFEWMGTGGSADFSNLKTFELVDDKTGKTVFRGEIKLRAAGDPTFKMAPEGTADPSEALPAPVYQLDFSAFSQTGVFRVVVAGLGASFSFRIDQNVWTDAAKIAAHGYLNQRSGLELGPPFTKFKRPRNFHPADGFPVYKTDPAKFYDTTRFKGGGNPFERIQAAIIDDQTDPNAWGGWHDAADFDRSILPQGHLRAVHIMLDLAQSNPAYFEKLNLNLPESKNAIPDIVDEALWCTELFRRVQQSDGGVPSAIESIEHPSDPSYLTFQPTALTPPTPQTCQLYAAAAAQMALVLEKYDAALSQSYHESALKALDWAAKNPQIPDIYNNKLNPANQAVNLAAFWMYRLTGETKWHDEFKTTLRAIYPNEIRLNTAEYQGPWGVVEYALLPAEKADAALQKSCRDAVLRAANAKVTTVSARPFGVGPQRFAWDERLGQAWELVAAHRLTGEKKYLLAIEQQANFALGLNPTNASYTTGIGSRQVAPFNLDANYLGIPFPEGITTYGPAPRNLWSGAIRLGETINKSSLFPAWENWPWAESYFDVRQPFINEYVVGGNMANQLLMRGYLAQTL